MVKNVARLTTKILLLQLLTIVALKIVMVALPASDKFKMSFSEAADGKSFVRQVAVSTFVQNHHHVF